MVQALAEEFDMILTRRKSIPSFLSCTWERAWPAKLGFVWGTWRRSKQIRQRQYNCLDKCVPKYNLGTRERSVVHCGLITNGVCEIASENF